MADLGFNTHAPKPPEPKEDVVVVAPVLPITTKTDEEE